jgi:cysteine synthase A
VEPAESPTLTTGCKVGNHRIQGISDEFVPELLELTELDEVISIRGGDAILMAQKLATNLGLAVGISAGCNFLAAVQAQEKLGHEAAVVTVFCDDNKKYLSTAPMNEEAIKPGYRSPEIELLGFATVGRACEFCH